MKTRITPHESLHPCVAGKMTPLLEAGGKPAGRHKIRCDMNSRICRILGVLCNLAGSLKLHTELTQTVIHQRYDNMVSGNSSAPALAVSYDPSLSPRVSSVSTWSVSPHRSDLLHHSGFPHIHTH